MFCRQNEFFFTSLDISALVLHGIYDEEAVSRGLGGLAVTPLQGVCGGGVGGISIPRRRPR